jgi:hypothetical protein
MSWEILVRSSRILSFTRRDVVKAFNLCSSVKDNNSQQQQQQHYAASRLPILPHLDHPLALVDTPPLQGMLS